MQIHVVIGEDEGDDEEEEAADNIAAGEPVAEIEEEMDDWELLDADEEPDAVELLLEEFRRVFVPATPRPRGARNHLIRPYRLMLL